VVHCQQNKRNVIQNATMIYSGRGRIECPPPDEQKTPKQCGRTKRSKARNQLERLQLYEQDVLRFMNNPIVPFTNNQGENDLRMTKVQQTISCCFRSIECADIFCRARSYQSTSRKTVYLPVRHLHFFFRPTTGFPVELSYGF
jgi:Transposase IS66 family